VAFDADLAHSLAGFKGSGTWFLRFIQPLIPLQVILNQTNSLKLRVGGGLSDGDLGPVNLKH